MKKRKANQNFIDLNKKGEEEKDEEERKIKKKD